MKPLKTILLFLLCSAAIFASDPLRRVVPTGADADVKVFVNQVAADLAVGHRAMFQNSMKWMDEYFTDAGTKQTAYRWIQGNCAFDVIILGYVHHADRLQRQIEETNALRSRLVASWAGEKEPDIRTQVREEISKASRSLAALARERDVTHDDLEEFMNSFHPTATR
jgi:intergrase/recombinase